MPSRTASCGVCRVTCRPSHQASYESPGWMPAIALISVDLPAPLSPTRATTSPAPTSKSTSVRASTAPNLFVTPLTSRRGRSGAAVAEAVVTCSRFLVLLDAVLGAGRLVRTGADLRRLPEAVLDDRRLDLVRGHRDHGQLLGLDVDLAIVLGRGRVCHLLAVDEGDCPRSGGVRKRLDRLVDVDVLVADEHPLDARNLGVLAGRRDRLRIDARSLHRCNRAALGSVIGGVDADEALLAERR